jgi:hypothetical protein
MRLGMPTPSPVAIAMMSDLLKPSSSPFSAGAVADPDVSPAAVGLVAPVPFVVALLESVCAGGVVDTMVCAGALDTSTLAVAQYPPYRSSILLMSPSKLPSLEQPALTQLEM